MVVIFMGMIMILLYIVNIQLVILPPTMYPPTYMHVLCLSSYPMNP